MLRIKDQLLRHFASYKIIDLAIIAFVGLVSLLWFKGNYFIKTGDDFFPLDPAYLLSNLPYLWLHFYSTGVVIDSFSITNLPFYVTLSGANAIGFSILTLQKLFYYFSFTISGISAYFLTSTLLHDNKRVAGLASAFFYMMNPYSLSVIWSAHFTTMYFTYASAPLFLGLFIKGIETKQKFRYAVYLGLLELIFAPMFDDPPEAAIVLLLIPVSFLIFNTILERKNRQAILGSLQFFIYYIFLTIAVNIWWILPAINLASVRLALDTGAYSSTTVFIFGSGFSTVWNSLRLLGFYFIWPDGFLDQCMHGQQRIPPLFSYF